MFIKLSSEYGAEYVTHTGVMEFFNQETGKMSQVFSFQILSIRKIVDVILNYPPIIEICTCTTVH